MRIRLFFMLAMMACVWRAAGGEVRQLWLHEDAKSIDHVALASNGNLLVMTDDRIALLDRQQGQPCGRVTTYAAAIA